MAGDTLLRLVLAVVMIAQSIVSGCFIRRAGVHATLCQRQVGRFLAEHQAISLTQPSRVRAPPVGRRPLLRLGLSSLSAPVWAI